jgi:hypothetical protein
MSNYSDAWQNGITLTKEVPVPEATVPSESELHALTGLPEFQRLDPETALQACDGHASGGVTALVAMKLPSGFYVLLCGHCARKAGYEHTATTPPENRSIGSDH